MLQQAAHSLDKSMHLPEPRPFAPYLTAELLSKQTVAWFKMSHFMPDTSDAMLVSPMWRVNSLTSLESSWHVTLVTTIWMSAASVKLIYECKKYKSYCNKAKQHIG